MRTSKLAMAITLFFFLAFSQINFAKKNWKGTTEKSNNSCLDCHKENEILPADFNAKDIHLRRGITCVNCHGGNPESNDPDEAMSRKSGFSGKPAKRDIPYLCGKCHSNPLFMRKYNPMLRTDQVKKYFTSKHGKALLKGDENVAVCTSCHTAHSILPPDEGESTVFPTNVPKTCNTCHGDSTLMDKYNLSSKQYEEYKNSVHGKALLEENDINAPACNDCHGNHGALPPKTISIVYVCGNCHINNYNYFKQTKMAAAFNKLKFHGCVECHGNHAIKKPIDNNVGNGPKAFCIRCHISGSKGLIVAASINKNLKTLVKLLDSAKALRQKVETYGMNDENIYFDIKDVQHSLIKARTTVHTFDSVEVAKITGKGILIAQKAIIEAKAEIKKYYLRKKYLIGVSLIFTLFLIILYIKYKVGKKEKNENANEFVSGNILSK